METKTKNSKQWANGYSEPPSVKAMAVPFDQALRDKYKRYVKDSRSVSVTYLVSLMYRAVLGTHQFNKAEHIPHFRATHETANRVESFIYTEAMCFGFSRAHVHMAWLARGFEKTNEVENGLIFVPNFYPTSGGIISW